MEPRIENVIEYKKNFFVNKFSLVNDRVVKVFAVRKVKCIKIENICSAIVICEKLIETSFVIIQVL